MDKDITKEHIFVKFPIERPSAFYITTKKEDCFFPIKDEALFTFCNYYEGRYNLVFCEIALLCKYYLRENFIINSDGFYCGLNSDWIEATNRLRNKNIDIRLESCEQSGNADVFIDSKQILNEFDKDGTIFNSMFKFINLKDKNS